MKMCIECPFRTGVTANRYELNMTPGQIFCAARDGADMFCHMNHTLCRGAIACRKNPVKFVSKILALK